MFCTEKHTDICQNRFGGKGEVILEHLIDEKVYDGKVVMYARVILKPGCSLGYHKHEGNSETCYVLQGTAAYSDNGKPMTLHAGDTVFCPDGESHYLENIGTDDLIVIGLVLKS